MQEYNYFSLHVLYQYVTAFKNTERKRNFINSYNIQTTWWLFLFFRRINEKVSYLDPLIYFEFYNDHDRQISYGYWRFAMIDKRDNEKVILLYCRKETALSQMFWDNS